MSTRGLNTIWYQKTKEVLRYRRINPEMPGYNLLLYGICELAVDRKMEKEELYEQLQKNYIVPIPEFNEGRHPAEQHMKEALKSVDIDTDPWNFINEVIDEVSAHNMSTN